MKPKKLIIISGITGAVGSALLAEYASHKNTCIYGISRQGLPMENFLLNDKFPIATLICSVGALETLPIQRFVEAIDFEKFQSVTYIHGLGLFPFEVNEKGETVISDDNDHDGINDECMKMTYDLFTLFAQTIRDSFPGVLTPILFGAIADTHHPSVHQSWWRVIEKTKEWMKNHPTIGMFRVFNISSVLCPHEIITRPFVFISTDARQDYWLKPSDLARFVYKSLGHGHSSFVEYSFYKKLPVFNLHYYKDEHFTPRKIAELYK